MENILHLCGDIAADPVPSHESHGIVFYTFPLSVLRLSGAEDLPNIIAPEIMLRRFSKGERVRVFGQVRSFSRRTENGSHLIISAWAKSIDPASDEPYDNRVRISGTVARPPIYRCTPYGREITDIMLKCTRPTPPRSFPVPSSEAASAEASAAPAENTAALSAEDVGGFAGCRMARLRCDFIPCVTWGSVARHCAELETGAEAAFLGRLQSRPYTKLIDGLAFNRVAYEVSVAELES